MPELTFFEKFLPFILPIGLFVLSTVIDSLMKDGQVLHIGRFHPLKPSTYHVPLLHFCKYMHNFYFACFAYDLAALIQIVEKSTNNSTIEISKKLIVFIVVGTIFHILAYFHSYYIQSEFDKQTKFGNGKIKVERPMTALHLIYAPISVVILIYIRQYQL